MATTRDKERRLQYLMSKQYTNPSYFTNWKKIALDLAAQRSTGTRVSNDVLEQEEIYKLASELKIEDAELRVKWFKTYLARRKKTNQYGLKPPKEGRDNKDVQVGSGGSNRSKIRYPSKKRSVKTWKKFYKLFPMLAIEDGFDGKTSKRMK